MNSSLLLSGEVLAPPQQRVPICLTFNTPVQGRALEFLLPRLLRAHRYLMVFASQTWDELAPHDRAVLAAYPQVAYRGGCFGAMWIQYNLHLCAQAFNGSFVTDGSVSFPSSASPAQALAHIFSSAATMDGVMSLADDMFFNASQVFLPPPHGRADCFALSDSWLNSWPTTLDFSVREDEPSWKDGSGQPCRPHVLSNIQWPWLPDGAPIPDMCTFLNRFPAWTRELHAADASIRAVTADELITWRIPVVNFDDLAFLSAADGQARLFMLLLARWDLLGLPAIFMEVGQSFYLAMAAQWASPHHQVSRSRLSELSVLPAEWAAWGKAPRVPVWHHPPIDLTSPAFQLAERELTRTNDYPHIRALDTNGYVSFRRQEWDDRGDLLSTIVFDGRYQFAHTVKTSAERQRTPSAIPVAQAPRPVTPDASVWQGVYTRAMEEQACRWERAFRDHTGARMDRQRDQIKRSG